MTALEQGLAIAKEYCENAWTETYDIQQKKWEAYGKKRIYITFTLSSTNKVYRVGYVDMLADKFVKTI